MAATTANLFRRKSLDGILATFSKAAKDLDAFIDQANSDKAGLDREADKIAAEREVINTDIARANRAKAKLADLIA